jgi:hypothetical protein
MRPNPRWEEHANAPHDSFSGLWPMAWPEVGGGGGKDVKLSEDQLFARMCAWDAKNYILGAGTKAGSDTENTDGIVDGHAYTVLTCAALVAGTEFDLVKVRKTRGAGGSFPLSYRTSSLIPPYNHVRMHTIIRQSKILRLSQTALSRSGLVQVRNPWGSGEIKSGVWDDDGPGSCSPNVVKYTENGQE